MKDFAVRGTERLVAKLLAGFALVVTLAGAASAQTGRISEDQCDMPQPSERAVIALFGAYEGQAISSAAVNGLDHTTTLAFVDIEPGARPLYVVLVSYRSVVWVFRGATGRVANAVLVTGAGDQAHPGVGAVGLPAARVTSAYNCFSYFSRIGPPERAAPYEPRLREAAPAEQSSESEGAEAYLRAKFGRPADVVATSSGMLSIALPSGRTSEGAGDAPPREGFHPRTWAWGLRFHPGGLVQVNPDDVVGAHAEAYDVLPDQMGLAQLVGAGQLQYMGGYEQRGLGDYRIIAPIPRFPSELTGAHAVRFLIEPGVPMPAGDPGHSCIVFRDGPRVLDNGGVCEVGY